MSFAPASPSLYGVPALGHLERARRVMHAGHLAEGRGYGSLGSRHREGEKGEPVGRLK